ncbi:SNF1-interacting protein [Lithohypha guttulata]|uniref:SNF1-interacting protein n=1 Tax=Lithohypha guttulata TaxID=1690604 RepID=A0AAN7YK81_9EURO|nr:SNF1-interacting protein [Lithohypha guttulata]
MEVAKSLPLPAAVPKEPSRKLAPTEDLIEVGRLINLIPVGLKEAAIDSPTSRATIQHYTEQIDLLEKWLDDYLKATNRLVAEHVALENIINNFTQCAVIPTAVSETMLDHDYSVLAMRKYAEGAKDYWMSMVTVIKRLPSLVCEPIRLFQSNELKVFRETRKSIDHWQKQYDTLHSKYMALGRYKEPSSIREEAFQLHETRKQYLRAVMDLFQTTPQFRFKLDKLLVRIFSDQWREMRQARDNTATTFQKSAADMDRVRGWIREMENSESSFQRELAAARKQLEEEAEITTRPSRELDDYSAYSLQHTTGHSHTASTAGAALTRSPAKATFKNGERAGWLFLRTYSGKPTRTVWLKRWAFVRNGVFGWLVHDPRLGGVEESERLGVLLCAVRSAPQEERRFCFELKTNRNTILLQAETQADLTAWIAAFEAAKAKAVHDPASSDSLTSGTSTSDPAFSISAPPVPEFGTSVLASTEPGATDDMALQHSSTLPLPGSDDRRGSFDVSRRGTGVDETQRDHASRIMSKLDLSRRAPTTPQLSASPSTSNPAGGIASLIAASHGSMPVGPSIPLVRSDDPLTPKHAKSVFTLALRDMPPSTLAPSTLANAPAPTSLSKAAVAVSGELGIRGSVTGRYGIPNAVLANTWGSSNSSFVNRFDRSELRVVSDHKPTLQASPLLLPSGSPPKSNSPIRATVRSTDTQSADLALPLPSIPRGRTPSPTKRHRNTISFDKNISRLSKDSALPDFPNYYPLQLKTQDAQFRLLFPNVRRDERLTMVFRATWNPSGQQDFPGRAYVTTKELYFYSNHFGLVLTSGISLSSVDEVTAAPGKDCDFLFVHFKEQSSSGTTRITIKTFLEPLKLLQRRLNYLVKNSQAEEPQSLEEVIKQLMRLETEVVKRTPSSDSWENISGDTPVDAHGGNRPRAVSEYRAPTRIDHGLYGSLDERSAFKLPAQPVKYVPPGYNRLAVEREYDISPKALFHVMFGDRSALWQLLQHERRARDLKQGPWSPISEDSPGRLGREFSFSIPLAGTFGRERMRGVRDYQTIDVMNEHLCYVVTDRRTPWHLPFQSAYRLISKIVITHVAKTKCKLAIYIRVDWSADPWVPGINRIIEQHALDDLDLDAQDLTDLVTDQVRRLGFHSRTKKAIQIFGQVGHSSEITQLHIEKSAYNIEMRRSPQRRTLVRLFIEDLTSAAQRWIGSIMQAILDFAAWLNKTMSANSLILALLAITVLYSSFFTLRDSWAWYNERNTANFMRRLGVTPDNVMGRAIYLSDLDVAMASTGSLPSIDTNVCYSVFHDDYLNPSTSDPFLHSHLHLSEPSPSSPQTAIAHRLHLTRENLALKRHDLIVAMRVVNSIEREVIVGEYEKFAIAEHRRCKAIEPIFDANGTSSSGGGKALVAGTGGSKKEQARLLEWYAEYCGSCGREAERIRSESL